jgi:uncharacterized Zn finger protein
MGHSENIYSTCPNCGSEVELTRYDNNVNATGSCWGCGTDIDIDVTEAKRASRVSKKSSLDRKIEKLL